MTWMATQIPTSRVTDNILMRILIVFHRNRCEHPRRSMGLVAPFNSSALYWKSDFMNPRRERCDGTRGMIFGR